MKLIWTYDGQTPMNKLSNEGRKYLLNYYILSITNAKKFKYKTSIYVDSVSAEFFTGLVDEMHIVSNKYNSLLFDYLKIQVIEDEKAEEYCLIDGDLILHQRLPIFNSDIVFDTYEISNWKYDYEEHLQILNRLNIKKYIPDWNIEEKPILNCGLLYIKDLNIKNEYVDDWKIYNQFINDNISNNTIDSNSLPALTSIGAQYLLTLLVNKHKLNLNAINSKMGEDGKYYKHFYGYSKYNSGNVFPTNYSAEKIKSII
jgi:hypothetical protein